MSNIVKRLRLTLGVFVSLFFPGIFVFSQPIDSLIFYRFALSFFVIITIWVVNFALVDFSPLWTSGSGKERLKLYARILLSFVLVFLIYTLAGSVGPSGLLLSQVEGSNWYSTRAWFFLILRIALFNTLFILIKYLFDSHEEKRRKEMEIEILKRENVMALNESLKQQISPHFLFNSLNTLKSLVKQGTELPLVFIDELSSVYRYMLSHYGKNEVTMEEEVSFSTSYLHLLKLRFGESIFAQIDIPPRYLQASIPPNTLQILIENAVKHNVLSNKRPLRISIKALDGFLVVENNLQQKPAEEASSYVGLSNINNRYNILKGKSIIVERDDQHFRVKLPMS
ncbi:MAG TPA: histidine kinase [Chryseolinea sp.]|nr:histidine kinase [Chryseolinea sp.]